MKKYNTPKMNVSMFENESVLTLSAGQWEAQLGAATETGTAYRTTWQQLKDNGLEVSF